MMTILVSMVALSLCVVCMHCTRTRGEYVPSHVEAMVSMYQVNYLPEWAMYGTTCTYTRVGIRTIDLTHEWEHTHTPTLTRV